MRRSLIVAAAITGGLLLLFPASAVNAQETFTLSVGQWITPNPPEASEMAGNVCVVEFWATWCGPCMQQMPHMMKLASHYEDRNVVFIGLSQDRSVEPVKAVVKKKNVNYHIAMDDGSADKLGINGIPAAIIINHKGELVWGGHPGSQEFEFALAKAVAESPSPLLEGVELGTLKHLRLALCGGKQFAAAYQKVEAAAKAEKSEIKGLAQQVLAKVNEKITARIAAAEGLCKTDTAGAIKAYKDIVERFRGIKITEAAQKRYAELVEQGQKSKPAVAKSRALVELASNQ